MNGDRNPDLVTANTNSIEGGGSDKGIQSVDGVSVLLNKGDGRFRPKLDYRTYEMGFGSVAIGDLNRDGKPDVAIGVDSGMETVPVLLNGGGGRLKKRIDYNTGPSDNGWGPRSVAIGDLNGDGKPDLATVKQLASVLVLLNTTRG
jgi:hypothetical protein